MVVIFFPATDETGVMQERVASPSICTVQAPHRAIPQPNFVPVMPRVSRRTHNSGIFGGTSTDCCLPLRINWIAMRVLRGRNAVLHTGRPETLVGARPLCRHLLGSMLLQNCSASSQIMRRSEVGTRQRPGARYASHPCCGKVSEDAS